MAPRLGVDPTEYEPTSNALPKAERIQGGCNGGLTKTGDAELTDREIRAQGRKATVKTRPKYVKRTAEQIITGTKKRRAVRTKSNQDFRMRSPACDSE